MNASSIFLYLLIALVVLGIVGVLWLLSLSAETGLMWEWGV